MVQITVRKQDQGSAQIINYKNGRKLESQIYIQENGKIQVYCAFNRGGCISFDYDNLEKAEQNTIKYLNNIHCYSGGVELIYK